MTRKLATVERISAIRDIPDADAIVCATIRGWDVVVKRDEFAEGDTCLYIEVDTLVDATDPRFEFLAPRGVRTDAEGVSGHVLKTAKLRGQYSQGLALPLNQFPEIPAGTEAGTDVTDLLPVKRWDPPMPAQLAGSVVGAIPSWIRKTDEERVQNLDGILAHQDLVWVATEKLDGTSTTVYCDPTAEPDRRRGVCSRNYDLTPDVTQTQWRLATEANLHERIEAQWPGQRVVLQGETIGEGVQGNPLRIKGQASGLSVMSLGPGGPSWS